MREEEDMTASKEKLGSNRVRLEVEVPAARFQESIERAYRNSRGEFTIPGFRKGKAPRAVIESHYGPGIFYNKAFDDLFPEVYSQAVQEVEVVPVGPPENLTFLEVDGSKGIRFSVELYTMPEVTLGNYRNLEARRLHHTVSESEIDDQLEALRLENSRYVDSEAPAQAGDQVDINYVGTLDGEPFEGGSADGTTVEIGSGTFIPGFEDGLVGAVSGEDRDIVVTFPEGYHAADLAGREAVFAVHVNAVKHREMPALDDDFAEDVSEFDTLAELRGDIRTKLQNAVDNQFEGTLDSELLGRVMDDSVIDVPPVMVDSEISDRLAEVRQGLMFRGVTLEEYLQAAGTDLASYAEAMRPEAERTIKLRLIVPALVRELDAEPTAEELEEVYSTMAADRHEDPEEFKRKMGAAQKDAIASREGMQRMLKKLKGMSVITDVDLDEEKTDETPSGEEAAPEV